MTENRWNEYVAKTRNDNPRPLLVEALAFVKEKGQALDLGSGALNDVRYLLEQGFKHITALDSTSVGKGILAEFSEDKFSYIVSSFEAFDFSKDHFDLVSAQYALPFNPAATFLTVFELVKGSLKQGGIFTGQLFGTRDEWNTGDPQRNFHSREEAEKLFADMEVLKFEEEEKEGPTALGKSKHWHVFHIIARK